MHRIVTVGFVVLCLLALGGALLAATTPEQRCEASKKQEAGKYASCRLKAAAKLGQGGDVERYNTALDRCAAKLGSKFLRLEGAAVSHGATCPTTNDAADVIAYVGCAADVVTDGTMVGGSLPFSCSGDDGELVTCQADLTSCEADLGTVVTDLAMCDVDLTDCGIDLYTAQADLTTCDGNLTTCEGDLVVAFDCGDGGIDVGEDCDLGNLNGGTCAGEGFVGGVLRCGAGCVYDTSECYSARFVDNANGTITDNDSGLTWEKKVKLDSTTDLANLQDADNVYRWSGTCSVGGAYCQPDAATEAACVAGVGGNNYACAQCVSGVCNVFSPGLTVWQWLVALNGASFGGHNDWRVPTKSEYVTIIDDTDVTPPVVNVAFHGASCGVACTDVTDPACSCTRSYLYWSASPYAPDTDAAWYVSFTGGGVDTFNKPGTLLVRAVRGGS